MHVKLSAINVVGRHEVSALRNVYAFLLFFIIDPFAS